jgi:Fur family transcriptional regulator, zinc uptake regulator
VDQSIQAIIEQAKQNCATEGVKLTTKRENILSSIIVAGEAVSAYELADLYKEQFGQTIPAMSVYRILDFLVELSLVHKLTSANKYIACSHISCAHQHEIPQFLICESCQSVTEIGVKNAVLDELKSSVEKTGFKLTNQQLELKGLCADCQA